LSGAVLGLTAPGFDQWYLAWCGLVPFFVLVDSSRSLWRAGLRGWLFGFGYHLLWLSFFLKLNPPLWIGLQSPALLAVVSVFCWLVAAWIYASVYALASGAIKLASLRGWMSPIAGEKRTGVPALLAVPLIWFCAFGICGNLPDFLLMPMASLEYSQYRMTWLIQACSIIGGVGLQLVMVAHNVALSAVTANAARGRGVRLLWSGSTKSDTARWISVLALAAGLAAYGGYCLQTSRVEPDTSVSVIQAGLMLKTEERGRGLNAVEALAVGMPLLQRCPPGLAVWTETSLMAFFHADSRLLAPLRKVAAERHLDIVFGIEEEARSPAGKYNAAAGVKATGELAGEIYKKRYLIPLGEFEPFLLRCIPPATKEKLRLPQSPPYLAGSEATVLALDGGRVAPLICGENVDAGVCARSVRNGGQVFANISNLSWFQDSSMGDLTLATAVLRAVENRRYYIYAADTGPSFVVDQFGRVVSELGWGQMGVLSGKFRYLSELSPFSRLWIW
jgi:apolipoprotein N-acyltransferase